MKAKNGMGGNIQIDLALEHYNRVAKQQGGVETLKIKAKQKHAVIAVL